MTPASQPAQLDEMKGKPMLDRDRNEIGRIADVLVDQQIDQPFWLGVSTSRLRSGAHLVPANATRAAGPSSEDGLICAFTEDQVNDAPTASDDQVTPDQAREAFEHYGYELRHDEPKSEQQDDQQGAKSTRTSTSSDDARRPARPEGTAPRRPEAEDEQDGDQPASATDEQGGGQIRVKANAAEGSRIVIERQKLGLLRRVWRRRRISNR